MTDRRTVKTDRPAWMERRRLLQTVGGIGAVGLAGCLGGEDDADDENGSENGTEDDTGPENGEEENGEEANGDEEDAPERVEPGAGGLGGEPPGDATILWDGEEATLDEWEHTGNDEVDEGADPQWIEHDEYFEVELGTSDIRTRESFGDCHLHVEWRSPEEFEGYVDIEEDGDGQGPGNSGVFLMETYEIQVLQSYDNPTYPSGYAGSFYLAAPEYGAVPLVLPIRPPGEWNAYDIVWRGPRFDGDELQRYPQLTVFFNGVAITNHFDVPGPNWFDTLHDFDNDTNPHPMDEDGTFLEEAPIQLQDHGGEMDEVHYRNIWVRDLPESPVEIDDPLDVPRFESDRGVWEEREGYEGYEDAWDPDHPDQPEQIEPAEEIGQPPADADELFEEATLEPGDDDWESDEAYGDCQLHLEWQVPEDAEAEGPLRGDSGVMLGDYEIQILDNYENPTDPEEWAGAYTHQEPPHHDAVRESGEWQQFDIVFQGPRFEDGELNCPAQVTAFLNGVAVQTRLRIDGPNADGEVGEYEAHDEELPVRLQGPPEDGSEVTVRNGWVRSLVH